MTARTAVPYTSLAISNIRLGNRLASSLSVNEHRLEPLQGVTYRVKTRLKALEDRPLTPTFIPPGSTVNWHPGDYVAEMASVVWLGRKFLVIEADLFRNCERLADGPSIAQAG